MGNVICICMNDANHIFIAADNRDGLRCPICEGFIKRVGCVVEGGLPTYDELRKRNKPALGLTPRFIWLEERLNQIEKATNRYFDNKEYIPIEWIEEYNLIVNELNNASGDL
ncbi:hypothetical protein ACQKII_09510 [Lysinibacillus sp. NPDC048646]|uniref:hypothetical protein n=1 Tax=Lysinibacillus sp. NPDC048646 TaxID=3390574 RepID=UPI003CFFECDE